MKTRILATVRRNMIRNFFRTAAIVLSVVLLTGTKSFAGPLDKYNPLKGKTIKTPSLTLPNLPKPPKAIEEPLYDLGKKIDKTISNSKYIPHKPSDVITQPLENTLKAIPKPKPNVSKFTDPDVPSTPTKPSSKPSTKPSNDPGKIVDDKPQSKLIKPSNDPGKIVDDKPQSKPIGPKPSNNNIPSIVPNIKPISPPSIPSIPSIKPIGPPPSVIPSLPPGNVEPTEPVEPPTEQPMMEEWQTRELVIFNDTDETIEVYVRYYTIDDEDKWGWFPNEPGDEEEWAGPFVFEPREKSTLQDGDFVIDASKCQIKAKSKDSNAKWGTFNVTMVKKPYVAADMETYTFRLYLND